MTPAERVAGLQALARMVLEAKLATLHRSAAARAKTEGQLADLGRPMPPTDLSPMAEAQAEVRYNRWAGIRRAELNRSLALQTAAWMEARDAAALALGRAEALRMVRARLGRR